MDDGPLHITLRAISQVRLVLKTFNMNILMLLAVWTVGEAVTAEPVAYRPIGRKLDQKKDKDEIAARKAKVEKLLDVGMEVLLACAHLPATDVKAIIACTETQQHERIKKLGRFFPQHMFEMFIEQAAIRDGAKVLQFRHIWSKIKTTNKEAAKAMLEDALAIVPPELLTSANIDGTVSTVLDEALSKGEFEYWFGGTQTTKFIPVRGKDGIFRPLGSGASGLVYPITLDPHPKGMDANMEFVIKIFLPEDKKSSEESIEITLQRRLADYDAERFGANDKFVPMVITSDSRTFKVKKTDRKLEYIVMERTGITLDKWRDLSGDMKPTKEEIMRMITRTYFIMKAFHENGYRHGDCHANNWALSRTNNKVIFLFDFGRVRPMSGKDAKGDFMWMARDWWCWLTVVELFEPELEKYKTTPDSYSELKKLIKDLKKEMAKLLWFNPDNDYNNAPFFGLKAETYPAAMVLPEFAMFKELTESFMSKKEANLRSKVELYRWKPTPDSKKRKREAEVNPKFSNTAAAIERDEE